MSSSTPTPTHDTDELKQKQLINALRDFKVKDLLTGGETYFPFLLAEETAEFILSRDQSIKEQAEQIVRLDEIRRTMDAWHGKDDEEFADIMNDRIATLHSTNNTKEADS